MLPHICRVALILLGWSIVESKPFGALQPYHTNIWTSWWAWGGRCAPSSTVITPVHSHCHSEEAWGERGVVESEREVCLWKTGFDEQVGVPARDWETRALLPVWKGLNLLPKRNAVPASSSFYWRERDSHLHSKDQFIILSPRNCFLASNKTFKNLLDSGLQIASKIGSSKASEGSRAQPLWGMAEGTGIV